MSLPFLLSCRPASVQGAGSKLRSGGAGQKASYGGGRSSLDAGANQTKTGCKRSLAALSEQQVEHVPWQEIFGVEEDDGTALESVKLKRVGVVGLQDSRLGAELVECFAAKPSVVNVGIHHGATGGASSKFDIMPGVTTLPTARDVCTWSDIIILCGSYEEAYSFLRTQGHHKALKGKCVLQLTSGTPEEALTASKLANSAGARYLDAFVFSEGTANVFNHRLSAMMVSGDKKAWREVEGVVRAAAPASFFGGRKVEWANTIGVGVFTFLASVRMGLNQAQGITTKFGLPSHVLPRVLNSGYMRVVKSLVTAAAVKPPRHLPATTTATSLQTSSGFPQTSDGSFVTSSDMHALSGSTSTLPSHMHGMHVTVPSVTAAGAVAAAATPPVGSQEWISQLERIREVCQKAQVEHSLIDGFLTASGSPQQQKEQAINAFVPLTAALAASHMGESLLEVEEPLGEVFGEGEGPESLDFDVQDILMDTDMVGDDVLVAGWAP